MIRLDSATRKLQAVLASAKTTTEPSAYVSYYDLVQTGDPNKGASQAATLNDTTDVDICAAPPQANVRIVDSICIANLDTVAAVVTVKIDDGGVDSIIIRKSVPAGSNLVYENQGGWAVV